MHLWGRYECVCACIHVCACGIACVCSCFCSIFIVLFSRGRQWNFHLRMKKVLPIKLNYTVAFMRLKASTPSLHTGDEACKFGQTAYTSSQPLPSLPLWFWACWPALPLFCLLLCQSWRGCLHVRSQKKKILHLFVVGLGLFTAFFLYIVLSSFLSTFTKGKQNHTPSIALH